MDVRGAKAVRVGKTNISDVGKACTGCMACMWICPNDAIHMCYSQEGFLYPMVLINRCSHCHRCLYVCQSSNGRVERTLPLKTYVSTSKNVDEVQRSTSGGIFFHLANYFINELSGYVCGAVLDIPSMKVQHIVSNKSIDLSRMQGSKYVQSDISDCYREIENCINNSKKVLFVGTPCQVAAIKAVFSLKAGTDNLYTIDLICHGVPSPKLFSEHVNRNFEVSKIKDFMFRCKDKYEMTSYSYLIEYADQTKQRIFSGKDIYYQGFLDGISFRESCYNCSFASAKRTGDITLGDCNTRKSYINMEKGSRVLSDVLLNTPRGIHLFKCIEEKLDFEKLNYCIECKHNQQLNSAPHRPSLRDSFYMDYKSLPLSELNAKYCKQYTLPMKVKYCIKRHTTAKVRWKVQVLMGKIRRKSQ